MEADVAAVRVPLRPASLAEVGELLRRGPAVPPRGAALVREIAVVDEGELLLLFEGDGADRLARSLTREHGEAFEGSELRSHVAGRPRLLRAAFVWQQRESSAAGPAGELTEQGVSFGPLPGPGNSDGGGESP